MPRRITDYYDNFSLVIVFFNVAGKAGSCSVNWSPPNWKLKNNGLSKWKGRYGEF
jgi:hypothetical protein